MELMKGSLNTFLNAFTYPDRTCYPVASCNLQVAAMAFDLLYHATLFHPAVLLCPATLSFARHKLACLKWHQCLEAAGTRWIHSYASPAVFLSEALACLDCRVFFVKCLQFG